MSVRVARATLVALLAGLAIAAPSALALPPSPFAPGLPQSSSTAASTPTATAPLTATAPTSSTSSTDTGLSGSGVIVIAIGAIVVLCGISLFIWRDARRRAPVRHRAAAAGMSGSSGVGGRGAKQRGKPRKLSPAERRRRKRGRAK